MSQVEKIVVGLMRTNCYVIKDRDTSKFAIIDPGHRAKKLDEKLDEYGFENCEYILLTHGHFDHILAAKDYRDLTHAKIVIPKKEENFTKDANLNLSSNLTRVKIESFDADIFLNDLDTIMLGNTKITLISTPGHTIGSSCYIADNMLFSGDTLMKDTIGATNFETGNYDDMIKSLKRIGNLKGNYKVFPGHGELTTLDYERNNNIYLGKINYEDIY